MVFAGKSESQVCSMTIEFARSVAALCINKVLKNSISVLKTCYALSSESRHL